LTHWLILPVFSSSRPFGCDGMTGQEADNRRRPKVIDEVWFPGGGRRLAQLSQYSGALSEYMARRQMLRQGFGNAGAPAERHRFRTFGRAGAGENEFDLYLVRKGPQPKFAGTPTCSPGDDKPGFRTARAAAPWSGFREQQMPGRVETRL
jgi:hypothetical protein